MASFKFRASDATGAIQQGEIDSVSRTAAMDVLVRRGLTPVQLTEAKESSSASLLTAAKQFVLRFNSRDRIAPREVVTLTKTLASLLNAGLTVDRALSLASQMTARPEPKRKLEQLAKAVRSGQSFTDALSASGLELPPYYSSMVQAGEAGGSLPQTLSRLGELLRRQLDLRERVISALVYPAILAGVVLATLVILVAFVLPRFEALFAESDTPLPLMTRCVLAIGNFTSQFWWLLLLLVIASVIAVTRYLASHTGRQRLHQWLLKSRWTFELPLAINTARFLQTLGTLLANGVPLASALRIAKGTLSNLVLQQAIDEVAQRVKAGESMTVAMLAVGVFPIHAVQLARVGEETGRLEDMLREAAGILEEDTQRSLERLLTMLVPAITITMGLLVAGLIGSVLIGLLSINDLAL